MPTSDVTLTVNGSPEGAAVPCGTRPDVADTLDRTFGVEFDVVDGASGERLHHSNDQPTHDGSIRDELCREVARRRTTEIIQEEGPLVVLAIPLVTQEDVEQVAVATFVSRPIRQDESLAKAAEALGLNPQTIDAWARRQEPWSPKVLRRVGRLIADQLASEHQTDQLRRVSDDLPSRLSHSHEEIDLLYRLTQNLKNSSSDEDLAHLTLDWLSDVLPSRGIAIQLVAAAGAGRFPSHGRQKSMLLTSGDCPVSSDLLGRRIARVSPQATDRSVVINGSTTDDPSWPFPEVRQLVAVPIVEGDNLFGWLVAFNHLDNAEFGVIEANLMQSVGTLLGIHSCNTNFYRHQSELLAGIVKSLTSAIDAKDPYTCGHSDRVARVAALLAKEMRCDSQAVDTIHLSGLLHDIGKIGINDSVLGKPGNLSASEYEHLRSHVTVGHKILADLKSFDEVLPVVLCHHESYDGSGYPNGLAGEEIPLAARIVAVADAFDAMASDRPYRDIMPDEKVDQVFRKGSGQQWDSEVVDAFFRVREEIRDVVKDARCDTEAGLNKWV